MARLTQGSKAKAALAWPAWAQKPPSGQVEQFVAPIALLKLPAAQGWQPSAARPKPSLYVPGMHGRHDPRLVPATPGSPCVPGGQATGTAVS